jgi:hypothetical protein
MKQVIFIISTMSILVSNLFSQETIIKYLSGIDANNTVEWQFFCTNGQNSGKWNTIPVPSNWELQGFGTYNYGHDWKKEDPAKEHGLYKYSFEIPSQWKDHTINIIFDGSMTDTQVKINGQLAGPVHQGAFYRFKYDITKLLKFGGKNILEVDVAKHSSNESVNKAERQADFWIFGGIFRPVFLEVLPEIHIKRAALDPKANGKTKALVVLNEPIKNASITLELSDLNGRIIQTYTEKDIPEKATKINIFTKFDNVDSWNPESPYLYDLKISLKKGKKTVHEIIERIGFRTVEFREHDGFYVNGEKVVFKGVNRHSFWPETGRCLAEEHHLKDIEIMKGMNMNAVRMSHYIPDKRFLELCDSLGLFVLNEITGWQDGYDTIIGAKVIPEAVKRDHNHPCVVIWDNGNEGGWMFENEKWFHAYDIQNRQVIYPWLLKNGVDTYHYSGYQPAIGRLSSGSHPFMPTEFLHGLYDGGHGAGLFDFWQLYQNNPVHAGGFLWVLADEAVLRTDMPGKVYDSDGNHAPDGIVGPHREKEGSYYTIREIWSPVQIKPTTINAHWDGRLYVENKFIYTNLDKCKLQWKIEKIGFGPKAKAEIIAEGEIKLPDTRPKEVSAVHIDCKDAIVKGELFTVTAIDHHENALNTWSWNILQPKEKAAVVLQGFEEEKKTQVEVSEKESTLEVKAKNMVYQFDKKTGELSLIRKNEKKISLTGGKAVKSINGNKDSLTNIGWGMSDAGDFLLELKFEDYPYHIQWTVRKNGLLGFESGSLDWMKQLSFIGIGFNYPEEKCMSVKWMGSGPYRVWKNRLRGNPVGLWSKAYNNTITGESFINLIYPEFKGYHADLFWMSLKTTEGTISVISETPQLYFQLFTPDEPQHVKGGTYPPFPETELSFLYDIPAIGTKFKKAEHLGPASQEQGYFGHQGNQEQNIKLWFYFEQ